jgi:hypothetical protein
VPLVSKRSKRLLTPALVLFLSRERDCQAGRSNGHIRNALTGDNRHREIKLSPSWSFRCVILTRFSVSLWMRADWPADAAAATFRRAAISRSIAAKNSFIEGRSDCRGGGTSRSSASTWAAARAASRFHTAMSSRSAGPSSPGIARANLPLPPTQITLKRVTYSRVRALPPVSVTGAGGGAALVVGAVVEGAGAGGKISVAVVAGADVLLPEERIASKLAMASIRKSAPAMTQVMGLRRSVVGLKREPARLAARMQAGRPSFSEATSRPAQCFFPPLRRER